MTAAKTPHVAILQRMFPNRGRSPRLVVTGFWRLVIGDLEMAQIDSSGDCHTVRERRLNVSRRCSPATIVVLSLVVFSLATPVIHPASATSPTMRPPLERLLLNDVRDGHLDDFTFLDASLIASGVTRSSQLEVCRQRFDVACDRFRLQLQNPRALSDRELADAILRFLHEEILTADYQIKTTRVDQALTTGYYNCVASTILFRCLSSEFGADPVVVATPSHVFCQYDGESRLAVETTCPEWFSLPTNSDLITHHPANNASADVRVLSDVEVLGKLYYNRATDMLDRQRFASACELLRTSMTLDPGDGAARENLLAAMNNWALQRCEAGDFAQAAQLLDEGAAISSEYLPLQVNDLHVHQQWAVALCQRQEFAAALALLERGYQRRPDADLFDQGRFAIYGLWADFLFSQGKDAEAWRCLDQAREQHPGRAELEQRETVSILRAVQQRLDRHQDDEARVLLNVGISRQPNNVQIRKRAHDLTDSKS